jgi:1,4-dihydroxy-2-naphthoate octaprenyltransferase
MARAQMQAEGAGAAGGGTPLAQLPRNWLHIINTTNLPRGAAMDPVSRWLIITRASVFTMTLTSGAIGGLLAASGDGLDVNWWFFALALAGIVMAHAANNLINDYFDVQGGIDDLDYPRAQYAPHPLLSGLTTRRTLFVAIALLNLAGAAIMGYLALERGPLIVLFALLGLFISVFYVAPPVVLKRRGLGEIGVLIVWGPLMIGGTFFAATGELPGWMWAACIPYSLIVMAVLMGKHLDKLEIDRSKGIRTLPVVLGFGVSVRGTQALMLAFYVSVAALVLTGVLSVWVAVVALALPRLVQVLGIYHRPKPSEPPPGYPVWPLWYVSAAFYFNRRAGELFVLGLLVGVFLPVYIRW